MFYIALPIQALSTFCAGDDNQCFTHTDVNEREFELISIGEAESSEAKGRSSRSSRMKVTKLS